MPAQTLPRGSHISLTTLLPTIFLSTKQILDLLTFKHTHSLSTTTPPGYSIALPGSSTITPADATSLLLNST